MDPMKPYDTVVQISQLTRRFGSKVAIDNLSLTIPRGGVFGLIGGNGAGKTTLLKHILGMLTPQSGSVRVFGMDPLSEPEKVLGQIGYLSEERDLPNWMRIRELMRYTRAFYPNWDEKYAEELREQFDLDPKARARSLSRGQRARAGLLVALAHRPQLLVLDEPSSGLDPIVRRDILGAIIRTIADEGRTVLFSSHLLEEVERVADYVAIIHRGKIVTSDSMDSMKESYRRLTLRFDPSREPPQFVNAWASDSRANERTYVCKDSAAEVKRTAEVIGAQVVEDSSMTLDEIFVASVSNSEASGKELAP